MSGFIQFDDEIYSKRVNEHTTMLLITGEIKNNNTLIILQDNKVIRAIKQINDTDLPILAEDYSTLYQ